MARNRHRSDVRGAFTLVEMLVVITIIGILAGLITAAAAKARTAARKAQIKTEISQLAMALEKYKTEHGEYPPAPTGQMTQAQVIAILDRHILKVFPKYDYRAKGTPSAQFQDDLQQNYGLNVAKMDPAASLVFWLGGLPADPTQGGWKPEGFHTDPQHPFKKGVPRTTPGFDFNLNRLSRQGSDDFLRLYPRSTTEGAPYVYFRPVYNTTTAIRTYAGMFWDPSQVSLPNAGAMGFAVPYRNTGTADQWREQDKFQLISAGMDESFGAADGTTPRETKTGTGFTQGDFDNITNFSEGTLEDEIE